jgi:hypothetical protein
VSQWINFSALAKILIGGLICGAGLPALFAFGLRALRMGAPSLVSAAAGSAGTNGSVATADDDALVGGSRFGKVVAGICFLVVLGAIVWGIYWMVTA